MLADGLPPVLFVENDSGNSEQRELETRCMDLDSARLCGHWVSDCSRTEAAACLSRYRTGTMWSVASSKREDFSMTRKEMGTEEVIATERLLERSILPPPHLMCAVGVKLPPIQVPSATKPRKHESHPGGYSSPR